MGTIASFKSTYLTAATPVLPPGARAGVAGAVYQIEDLNARGMSIPTATNLVQSNRRVSRIVHDAQQQSSPFQMNLVSDFIGISAP